MNAVLVDNFEQLVTYEGLNRFCFSCGRIGHRREECFYTVLKPAPKNPSTPEDRDSPNREDSCAEEPRPCATHDVDPKDDTYDPWMVVSRKKSSSRKDKRYSPTPTNSMHALRREGTDERTATEGAAKMTPGSGSQKITEGNSGA